MHTELRLFLSHLAGTIALTAAAVVLAAFVSIPYSLERYPGDPVQADAAARHMT